MQNRSEAIAYLQERGFEAFARDWVLGETIGIPVGKKNDPSTGEDSIVVKWAGLLYIYAIGDQWAIHDTDPFPADDTRYSSLCDAVLAAEKIAHLKDEMRDRKG